MTGGRVTSQDVANLAGVSRSAVSLVLNGRADGMISSVKQQAVRDAARQLDYVPNSVALSLRTQRTSLLGVVVDSADTSPATSIVLMGAGIQAIQKNYLLLIIGLAQADGDEDRAGEILRTRQVDGMILVCADYQERPSPLQLRQGPAVLTNCADSDGLVRGVMSDERAAIALLVDHLVERGHRDIVVITPSAGSAAAQLRTSAFAEAMHRRGLPVTDPVSTGRAIADSYAAAMCLLDRDRRPTAIIAAGDHSALGVSLAAAHRGLSVPRDLSLVTIEEDPQLPAGLVPALTAVRQPYLELGRRAVDVVLAAVGGAPQGPGLDRLVGELMIRESVAPPAP